MTPKNIFGATMSKNLGVVKKLTKWPAGCGLIEL